MFEYGWPGNFRKDDFRCDIDDMQEQWRRDDLKQWEFEGMTKNLALAGVCVDSERNTGLLSVLYDLEAR